jgi:Uma2 family endonuclease
MSTSLLPDGSAWPASVLPITWKLDSLQAHLGGVPLNRIRLFPPPGRATDDDAAAIRRSEGVLCEVVDGVLVEKTMGWKESAIAGYLLFLLNEFLARNRLGVALAPDGPVRTPGGKTRLPDVSYVSWERLPPEAEDQNVCPVVPDLAVEVLSEGNTSEEIEDKLQEYFSGGAKLAWVVDRRQRNVAVYRSPGDFALVAEDGILSGGEVLPGFQVSVAELLASAERPE